MCSGTTTTTMTDDDDDNNDDCVHAFMRAPRRLKAVVGASLASEIPKHGLQGTHKVSIQPRSEDNPALERTQVDAETPPTGRRASRVEKGQHLRLYGTCSFKSSPPEALYPSTPVPQPEPKDTSGQGRLSCDRVSEHPKNFSVIGTGGALSPQDSGSSCSSSRSWIWCSVGVVDRPHALGLVLRGGVSVEAPRSQGWGSQMDFLNSHDSASFHTNSIGFGIPFAFRFSVLSRFVFFLGWARI